MAAHEVREQLIDGRPPSLRGYWSEYKLNFDKELSAYLGPDHDLVLPSRPGETRRFDRLDDIAANLGLAFTFMSAHVFRRSLWQDTVSSVGIDRLCATRHFPHSFIFLNIARTSGHWHWLAEYCVIQRMGNFCILEENAALLSRYSEEVSDDIEHVWTSVLAPGKALRSLMKRLYFIYWNPVAVFIYMSDPRVDSSGQERLRRACTRRFRGIPLYWISTLPLLLIPSIIPRVAHTGLKALNRLIPLARLWAMTHGLLSNLLTRLRSGDRNAASAKHAAGTFLRP